VKAARLVALLTLLAICLAFPQVFPDPTITTVAIFTLMYATATTAWNIFSGYTGYIALGHAAYFGLGSYAMALLCQAGHLPGGYQPFVLLPVAGLIAAAFAVPLGWIALRTRKHT
jgi:branched-chain amino acid transport system permease protein